VSSRYLPVETVCAFKFASERDHVHTSRIAMITAFFKKNYKGTAGLAHRKNADETGFLVERDPLTPCNKNAIGSQFVPIGGAGRGVRVRVDPRRPCLKCCDNCGPSGVSNLREQRMGN
jgi:hypothetical protein